MILLVDNYDSFTYNLRHYLGERQVTVLRNDDPRLRTVAAAAQGIVFSPGPGRPAEAGEMEALIREFYQTKPMLGICLGHQAIGEVFGAQVVAAKEIMHGKTSEIQHHHRGLFTEIASPVTVMRYHSLILDPASLPPELMVTAVCGELVMAIQHRDHPIYGLQFHPESIGTPVGEQLIQHFLQVVDRPRD